MTAYNGRTIDGGHFGYDRGTGINYGAVPLPQMYGAWDPQVAVSSVGYSDEVATPAALEFPTSPVPSYALQQINMRKTAVTQFEDGKEQRIRKWDTGRKMYRMSWKTLTSADADILWDFYESAQGAFRSFVLYDPYDGVTSLGNYRFMEDEMSRENFEYALWNIGLDVIEVL